MHGAFPDCLDRGKSAFGVFLVQPDCISSVLEQQLPAVFIIRVFDFDNGLPEIGQLKEQLLAYGVWISTFNDPLSFFLVEAIAEQLEPFD